MQGEAVETSQPVFSATSSSSRWISTMDVTSDETSTRWYAASESSTSERAISSTETLSTEATTGNLPTDITTGGSDTTSTWSFGSSETNAVLNNTSTESLVFRSASSSTDASLAHSSEYSLEADTNHQSLPYSSSHSTSESVMDVTRDSTSASVSVGVSEATVFPYSSPNGTEDFSLYSRETVDQSWVKHDDVTTVLDNLADDSSDSTFMFLNPSESGNQNESVSNLTVTSLLGDEIMGNSTFLSEATHVYDVLMREDALTNDVSTAVMVTKAVTLTILAVGGVIGNALVIWSVVRRRHLHRPPFYYLLSLSLTDLSRAAFCLPLVLMTLLQGSVWRHGNSACDLFAFANSFFVLSSCVSLLDVAADRHLSLVYARSYRRRAGGAVNLVVVLLGWTLAFLVAFPPVVGVGSYAFEVNEGQCTLRHRYFRHDNDTLGFLMVFTGISLLTLFLYYRIFLALRANRRMRPLQHEPARSATWTFVGPGANGQAFINWVNGFGGGNVPNIPNVIRNPPRPNLARVVSLHVARNQHVTRLFFTMTLTFIGLWLPYHVLSYWRVFSQSADPSIGFITVAAWLSYAQVAVCPLVYFLARGPMRRRPSRADIGTDDKQEYLLESVNRKK